MRRRSIPPLGGVLNRWRCAATVVVLAVLGHAAFPAPAAGAVLFPSPDFIIKDHTGPHLTALRLRYSATAQALGDFPFVDVDSQQSTQTHFMDQGNWHESIVAGAGVAATVTRAVVPGVGQNITIDSSADLGGRVSVEKLGGHTLARLANGQATASAQVTLEFQDVIQITKEGSLGISWKVNGTATGFQHPTLVSVVAHSGAVAEVFIWPFGAVPATGQSIPFEWLGRKTFSPGQEPTIYEPAGRLFRQPPGSRWWVYGRLTIDSGAGSLTNGHLLPLLPPSAVESSAQFSNSAELFIDPEPETPDAAFISNSGYSYATPVPEPGSRVIVAGGAVAVLARRRRATA